MSRHKNGRTSSWIISLAALLAALQAGPAVAQPKQQLRLALVTTEQGETVQNILALVEAKLSTRKGFQLLDRKNIDRITAEQKLSLLGLVKGDQILAAGKLLSVDLFAVLETNAQSKEPVGMVVFDARTGARIWDAVIPSGNIDRAVAEVVTGAEAAVKKQRQNFKDVRTVCVMTVRNVDLPREKDSFCDSVGLLLERKIISSPSVALLERSRLEQVNQERDLPTDSPFHQLRASLVTVELQISRTEDGNGLRAVALLSDTRGQSIGKPAASIKSQDVQELTHALSLEVTKALKATPGGGSPDRAREVHRLVREAEFFWQHKDNARALRAMEAAYALKPEDIFLRAELVRGLAGLGHDILESHRIVNKRPSREELQRSLELINRATNQALVVERVFGDKGVPADKQLVEMYFNNSCYKIAASLAAFMTQYRQQFSGEHTKVLGTLQASYGTLLRQKGKRAMAAVKDVRSFQEYTVNLASERTKHPPEFYAAAPSQKEVMNDWLGLAEKHAAQPFSIEYVRAFYALVRTFQDLESAQQACLRKLRGGMERSTDPFVKLYSPLTDLGVKLDRKQLGEEEISKRVREFRLFAQQLIASDEGKRSKELRLLCYETALEVIEQADEKQRLQEMTELSHWMFAQNDVNDNVVKLCIFYSKDFSTAGYRKAFDVVKQASEALDSPQCHFLSTGMLEKGHAAAVKLERGLLRRDLVRERNGLLTIHPEFEGKIVTPWKSSRQLIDVKSNRAGVFWILRPIVHGNNVYALVLGADGPKQDNKYVQLLRVSLIDGQQTFHGKMPLRWKSDSPIDGTFMVNGLVIVASTAFIHEDRYYLGTNHHGIFVFSLDGKTVDRIDTAKGLPSDHVQGIVCGGGKLYAALGDRKKEGYLVAYDLKSGSCKVLASSRRKEKLSPFDDTSPLQVCYMTGDPERQRCLFVVYCTARDGPAGLWQIGVKTDKLDPVIPLLHDRSGAMICRWVSPIRDNTIWINLADDTVLLDLAKKSSRSIGGKKLDLEHDWPEPRERLEAIAARTKLSRGPQAVGNYHFIWNGWFWSAEPFGRTTLNGKQREVFPALRKKDKDNEYFFPREIFQLVNDNKQLLAGDQQGLWLLTLDPDKLKH